MRVLLLGVAALAVLGSLSARPISLKQSIDLALERNLGLMIAEANRSIAEEDLLVAESDFDLTLSLNTFQDETVAAGAGDTLEGNARPESNTRNSNLSVTKRLKTGTQITQSTNLNRRTTNSQFQLLDPDYAGNFQLEVRQPILNGRGKAVNLATVHSAQSRLEQSELQWRDRVLEVVAESERLYWNLAYAFQRKDYLQTSLTVAEQLLSEAEKRQSLGAATRLETLQARTALANRQSEAVLADQEIQAASDALRRGIGDLSLDSEVLEPTDAETNASYDSNVAQLYADVLEWSLDARIQEEVIRQNEYEKRAARNRVAPRLDIALTGRYLGREEQADVALESALEGSGYYWRTGLEFSMPIGMRADKARYRRAMDILDREKFRLQEIQQTILLDARDAYRDLAAAKARIDVTDLTVSLNQEQFDQERRRHEAGGSTFRNVLEAQEDLDEARMQRLEAIRDANQSLAQIQSMDGSLLDRHNFSWETLSAENE